MPLMAEPSLKTDRLGGVDVPSADILKKMHDTEGCSYIYTMIVSHAPADRNCTLRSAGAHLLDILYPIDIALLWSGRTY